MHSSIKPATLSLTLVAAMVTLATGCGSSSDSLRNSSADARSASSEDGRNGSASGSRDLQNGSSGGDTASNGGADRCALEAVYYRYNSSELDNRARATLNRNAECMQQQQARTATVTGMADPRGTEEYNMALGERRARVAARYISSRGVPERRVQVHSVGAEYARGRNEEGWSRDRRSEFSE